MLFSIRLEFAQCSTVGQFVQGQCHLFTWVGAGHLMENISIAVTKVPKTMFQEHWKDAMDLLLSKDEAFVTFNDFLKDDKVSKLTKKDVVEVLTALRSMGRVLWSKASGAESIIFPSLFFTLSS